MPYLKPEKRLPFTEGDNANIFELGNKITCAGDLNFIISTLISQFLLQRKLNYDSVNEMDGALDCANKEFYRRVIAPLEDVVIIENGDVYQDVIALIEKRRKANAQ